MTDIKLNPLNTNQRRLLQLGAVFLLVVFLTIFFIFSKKSQTSGVKNNSVYLQNGQLNIFDEVISINQYPDRIAFHYPYLVVVKPEQQKSLVYNLNTKHKDLEVSQLILDYFNGKTLYNQGNTTMLDSRDLGILCEKGFIKNNSEVLCITKVYKNNVDNRLVSINIDTNKTKEAYLSTNLLTDVSVINNILYIGEINMNTNKSYVVADGTRFEASDIVSLIFEMNGNAYFASYKSAFNSQQESSYQISNGQIIKQDLGKILFYK